MINHRICILGGTGFVGHHLVSRLAASGYPCRVLARRPERHRDLLLAPGTELRRSGGFETDVLKEQFKDCTAVVNLVGILNEGSGQTFQQVHVNLVEHVLAAAQAVDVPRYLHMSALHAQATEGTSRYLCTKGMGEDLAHADTGMRVTSFRPSVIFGPGDSFFNRFATLLKIMPGVFPLACPDARFAPVYVGDVVSAMVRALADPGCAGKRYDLCGPRIYSLKALVEYTADLIGRRRIVIGLPDVGARLQARIFQLLPGKPFTMDNYLSLQTDSICGQNNLAELGIQPQTMEALVPGYLR